MSARLLRFLSALALGVVVAGCGRDEVKVDFMNGCTQGGVVPKSTCSCVFDKVEKDLRAMHASEQMSVSNEVAQRLVMASASCGPR